MWKCRAVHALVSSILLTAVIVGDLGAQQSLSPLDAIGENASSLGSVPGSSGLSLERIPTGIQGSRPGPSTPRVPYTTFRPPTSGGLADASLIPPPELPEVELPLYGALTLPREPEEEGAVGLTLHESLVTLVRNNLDLRAAAFELDLADADIVTAGLRPNPILFADAQLIPYGSFTETHPGGPTQYDLNITYPIDFSGKRHARLSSAEKTRLVREAQYREFVRQQIDRFYSAFVDFLAAREVVRFSETSIEGLEEVVAKSESLYRQGLLTRVDVNRTRIQLQSSELALADAQESLQRATRNISLLLNLPPGQSETLQLRASLRVPEQEIPDLEQLVGAAYLYRPDLRAFQLAIELAQADLRLARANRFEDLFLLYQPYTFQESDVAAEGPATSWAIGLTIPLPVFDRNQGNIERAEVNAAQTQMELEALKRRIALEVQDAYREFVVARQSIDAIENEILPVSESIIEDSLLLFEAAEIDAIAFLNAQRDYNEVVRQYLASLIRYRRSLLALNTVVGTLISN